MTTIPAASPAPPEQPIRTGLARAVLAEVAAKLKTLAETGAEDAVDLAGLPMTDGDFEELDELLGKGEVEAVLEVAGRSEVWETAYPGAWRVRHRGGGDAVASEELVIARVPEIMKSPLEDCRDAAARLEAALAADRETRNARLEENSDA